MSYPAHRTGRSRYQAENVITLPRRSGGRPSGPAEQPTSFSEHVREILQRAADDLTLADAALQPRPGVPGRRGGLDGGDPIVPGVRDLPGHAERVADTRGGTGITVHMLGCFRVRRAGQEVARSAFGGRLTQQLLQILLTDRGQLVPKDVLIEALWPSRDPADPEANLGVLVSRARRALGEASLILNRPGGYLYAEDDRTWVDTEAFAREAERGRMSLASGNPAAALRAYRSALALWTGDPLMENMYADWAQGFRRRFSLLYEETLAGLAKTSLDLGQAATALDAARQLTQRAPLGENGHVLLMRALAAASDPAGAISAFHEWRARLTDELGVDPSPEAQRIFQRILRHEPAGHRPLIPQDMTPAGSQFSTSPDLAAHLFRLIPDAVYVLSHDERIMYANQSAADSAGLPAGSLTGMTARAVFPDDWLGAYRDCAEAALPTRARGCFRAFCAPLDSWLEWTVYPDEQGILILSRDVTRVVQAEERVRRALAAVKASRSELLTHAGHHERNGQRTGARFPRGL